ncbi:MAG: hypothetical protein ACLSFT_06080 [Ruminococcus callidus]
MGLLVYHEKGFDGKKRERILHRRESAAGVSRQQGVQDNWSEPQAEQTGIVPYQ